jgi:hypothetical protein
VKNLSEVEEMTIALASDSEMPSMMERNSNHILPLANSEGRLTHHETH